MDKETKAWFVRWRLLGSPRKFLPEQVEFFGQLPEIAFDYVPDTAVQFYWLAGTCTLDGCKEEIGVATARGLVADVYPDQLDEFGGKKHYFTGSVSGLPEQHATLLALLKNMVRDLRLGRRAADPPEIYNLVDRLESVLNERAT